MERFQCNIEIDAPASVCYEKWHHFDQFPHYMTHIKRVESLGNNRWHWVVTGPLGTDIAGDAEIDGDEPNRMVSCHTLKNAKVQVQGVIRFNELDASHTNMTCDIQYKAPGGPIGEALTNWLNHPHQMVEAELQNFKHLVEGTNVPTEKAHVGKILQPDAFVVGTATAASYEEALTTGYEGPYGMDNDVSDAMMMGEEEDNLDTVMALQTLQNEESPYLASEGAIHSEDLRDMQAFEANPDEEDVFTESLDVEAEDLESYTEGIDQEIDVGLGPREESPEPREGIGREA